MDELNDLREYLEGTEDALEERERQRALDRARERRAKRRRERLRKLWSILLVAVLGAECLLAGTFLIARRFWNTGEEDAFLTEETEEEGTGPEAGTGPAGTGPASGEAAFKSAFLSSKATSAIVP